MPFTIVRQDITKITTDAVVNAANTELKMGGGVCGAIFAAAGKKELQNACNELAPIQTGQAAVTPAFNLPAKYIIHTAGPIYIDGKHNEEKLLRDCYINSLTCAVENGCTSIAFPLISSGIYGYPAAEALKTASAAIQTFISEHEIDVTLAVFDRASFEISSALHGSIQEYIDNNYAAAHSHKNRSVCSAETEQLLMCGSSIDDICSSLGEPFSAVLFRFIQEKNKTESDVYKRANIDRKLFSKIRTIKDYMPSKRTAAALAVALELNLDETQHLLRCAGYALSHSRKFDVIVEYFIIHGQYNIFDINEVLFKYDQPLLGGV